MLSREEQLDGILNIRTSDDLEEMRNFENHTYQGTDYITLDIIMDMLELKEDDVLVDLGCGLGKVIYYVNHKIGCKTIGVEGDERIYKILEENDRAYRKKDMNPSGNVLVLGSSGAPVKIINSRIEDIISFSEEILEGHKFTGDGSLYFYIFNPVPADVLKTFIGRVIEEAGEHHFGSRKLCFVFYYMTPEYQAAVRSFPLKLEQISKLNNYYKDEYEKCCIYSL